MNINEFSPFVRVAIFSTLNAPFKINQRVIFDYEIILVADGKCKITINNTEYVCKKNDVVFLRPGIPHEFKCIDNSDFVQPHIHFDVLYTDKSKDRFVSFKPRNKMSQYELSLIGEDVLNAFIPYVFTPCDMNAFKKDFFEVIEIFQSKKMGYELLCKARMLELLNLLIVQFVDDTPDKPNLPYNPIEAIKNYIDNNYLSILTLDSLSKQFFINKYTLLRKFKSEYNITVINYYHNKRIEYIKNELKTTSLSITAISEKLNFLDIYSFSRFFKIYVGCSPTEYRKRN